MYTTLQSLFPQQIFLIQGSSQYASDLSNELKNNSLVVSHRVYTRFTIDDAKNFVTWCIENAGQEEVWCVLYLDIFVPEAAQVLLKTLEEPGKGIFVALITPHPYLIPQTVRSRVRLIFTAPERQDFKKVLASKSSAMLYIKEYLANDTLEASERRALATAFLDALEIQVEKDLQKVAFVYEAKKMLYSANMPTKQIAEYVVSMVY